MIDDKCRSCGQRIRWARTVNGRAMPLDPEPSERGNVYLRWPSEPGSRRLPMAEVLKAGELEEHRATGDELWLAHFATCPSPPRRKR